MILLEHMVRSCRFHEFVKELVNIRNEETNERSIWEFWLHKVHDMSYADFEAQVNNKGRQTGKTMTDEEIQAVIADSQDIMNNFCLS